MDVRSKIKQLFKAIPGGIMIVPLLFAMLINTLFPAFFKIGNLTTALFQEGVLTLLGLLFFLVGTQFQLGECLKTWSSGLTLLVYKLSIGSVLALIVYHFYGLEGVAGVTPLILLIALTQPNLAMFVAITLKLGRPSQLNILPLVVLLEMPLLIMFVLDINGMIQTTLTDYLAILLPFIVGIVVGDLFREKRTEFSKLIPIVIPLFAFSVGSQIHLSVFLQTGFTGVLITLLVLASGVGGFFLMKLISLDNATPGIALGSTASTSLVILPVLASIDERYAPFVPMVTAQLITVTVLTCAFCPMIAKYLQRFQRTKTRQLWNSESYKNDLMHNTLLEGFVH